MPKTETLWNNPSTLLVFPRGMPLLAPSDSFDL